MKISPLDTDRKTILKWMERHANGHRNAKKKFFILSCLRPLLCTRSTDIDRYFRKIMEELRHAGHVSSTCEDGYWFNPLHLNTLTPEQQKAEIDAQLHSLSDKKSRAMALLKDVNKQIDSLNEKKLTLTIQGDMFTDMIA